MIGYQPGQPIQRQVDGQKPRINLESSVRSFYNNKVEQKEGQFAATQIDDLKNWQNGSKG
jgi:hypothetical protein